MADKIRKTVDFQFFRAKVFAQHNRNQTATNQSILLYLELSLFNRALMKPVPQLYTFEMALHIANDTIEAWIGPYGTKNQTLRLYFAIMSSFFFFNTMLFTVILFISIIFISNICITMHSHRQPLRLVVCISTCISTEIATTTCAVQYISHSWYRFDFNHILLFLALLLGGFQLENPICYFIRQLIRRHKRKQTRKIFKRSENSLNELPTEWL